MIKQIVYSLLSVLIFAPALMANEVHFEATANQLYQTGSGGEFTFTVLNGTAFDYNAYKYNVTDGLTPGDEAGSPVATSFQTFCIEETENVAFNTTYTFGVSGEAKHGGTNNHGPAGPSAGGDVISNGTAYLYYHFAKGDLTGYNYTVTATRKVDAGLLQEAIWGLEDEIALVVTNPFVVLVQGLYVGTAQANSTEVFDGLYSVAAMNLFSDPASDPPTEGQYRQDMLTIRKSSLSLTTPEPSTLALYGLGLLMLGGGAVIQRRRNGIGIGGSL